jgi:hypothetical protein
MKTKYCLFIVISNILIMSGCNKTAAIIPLSSNLILHPVIKDSKYGYIDNSGSMVIPPQFDRASNFSQGLASIENNGKWSYINESGEIVINLDTPDDLFPGYFVDDLAMVPQGTPEHVQCGFINGQGEWVIRPRFDNAHFFSEDFAMVGRNDGTGTFHYKWGYIDKTGRLVISYRFDKADDFSEGLACVCFEGKYGFIDKTGKFVIQPKYLDASSFSEGLASVREDSGDYVEYGFIDKTGAMVITPQFAYAANFSGGLALVTTGENFESTLFGFIDTRGNFTIRPRFKEAQNFTEGLAMVKVNEKWGFIDTTGRLVIPAIYDFAFFFQNGLAAVRTGDSFNGETFLIDKTGKVIYGPMQAM